MFNKIAKLSIWKKILVLLSLGFVVFVGLFVYLIFTEGPPNFFPLDDSTAEYTITKNCPNGQGWVKQMQDQGFAYCLEYDNVRGKENGNTNFFRITIGKSNLNLETYLDKKVKNIKGKYVNSSKQCIQNKCVDFAGPYAVLNIDKLELAN